MALAKRPVEFFCERPEFLLMTVETLRLSGCGHHAASHLALSSRRRTLFRTSCGTEERECKL